MTARACIGEPISWLRLERYALARGDGAIGEHVAACAACRACLDEIEHDVVALPHLAVPARRRWWTFALPAFAAVAAAAIVLILIRPRERAEEGLAHVKGFGEVAIDVVRERGGTVRDDVRTFAAGDRWKVVVTCPLPREARFEVTIAEDGAPGLDRPLPAVRLPCGNRVIIPGAFTLSGARPHRVCVRVDPGGEGGQACLWLRPE